MRRLSGCGCITAHAHLERLRPIEGSVGANLDKYIRKLENIKKQYHAHDESDGNTPTPPPAFMLVQSQSRLPSSEGTANRDIGSYQGGFMHFGAKHNNIFPIIADMIRWHT